MKNWVVKLIVIPISLLVLVMMFTMPKKDDWSDYFSKTSKKAYGSKLIEKNLGTLFPGNEVEKVEITVYEHLEINGITGTPKYDDVEDYSEPAEEVTEDIAEESTEGITEEEFNEVTQKEKDDYAAMFEDTIAADSIMPSVADDELVNIDAIADTKIREVYSNYIFVNDELAFEETDLNALKSYVSSGNQVFMAATSFRGEVKKAFHLTTGNSFLKDSVSFTDFSMHRKKIPLNLFNRNFSKRDFQMNGLVFGNSFTTFDSSGVTEILGTNSKKEPNFIRIKHGKGYFYISAVPHAYTNYSFAHPEMAGYASSTLSYLPNQHSYWDEYYKVGRSFRTQRDLKNDLFKNPSISWAWNLVIIGLLIYMLFESKRNQRLIPVFNRLRNSTVEFVYTMGRLYMQKGDHHDLAVKKIQYFLEQIRHGFYIPTHEFSEEFLSKLSQRSGVNRSEVQSLFSQISIIQQQRYCSKEALMHLSKNIDNFKVTSKLH